MGWLMVVLVELVVLVVGGWDDGAEGLGWGACGCGARAAAVA